MVKIYIQDRESEACMRYTVDLRQSVGSLKAEIEEIEGIGAQRQYLEFEGKELEDHYTLQYYLVQEESLVLFSDIRNWRVGYTSGKTTLLGQLLDRLSRLVSPPSEANWEDEFNDGRSPWVDGGIGRSIPFQALYDWDGDMKHDSTKGLALAKEMDLIILETEGYESTDENWCLGRSCKTDATGWVPRCYIRSTGIETSDVGTPILPVFNFPSAEPLQFKVCLGERGHSYVQVVVKYEAVAPPGEATFVNVALSCVSTAERCITSVSLKIVAPGLKMDGVRFPDATILSSPNSVNIEATNMLTSEHHGDLNFTIPNTPLGGTAGGSRQSEQTKKETGTRESQLSIVGMVNGADTAHWVIEGRRGVGEREGVPRMLAGMSFVLQEKPTVFQYECFVTTTKRGKQSEHWGLSGDLISKWKRKIGFR
ncbi:hypothetical protein R3P38DRAFT_1764077 [Favolaschia claudopus]|uniref:Ubiquitin-like domain-containing protein n=1 Tax=Favolaschia claudopus TaxID=2862362 RepID=A0AAW0DGV2_9AGAR